MGDIADDLWDRFCGDDEDRSITCQRCGEDDLHWEVYGGIPKLYDEDGDRHVCEPDTKGFTAL